MNRHLLLVILITTFLAPLGAPPRESFARAASDQSALQAALAGASRYTITDLGTLGGGGQVYGMNDNGQVIGYSSPSPGVYRAFLWEDGSMQDLGTLGGPSSYAYDINNSGQVAGTSLTSIGTQRAFLWQNGGMQDLGSLGGSQQSGAFGINNLGHVVGWATTSGFSHAFLWSGSMSDLGAFDADSQAYAVNDSDQVVGFALVGTADPWSMHNHAFLWNGSMQDLGTLGWAHSGAKAINDSGQVVGHLTNENQDDWHAFLWDGSMQDLGGSQSYAWDINNAGLIVGESGGHAILWENGQMKDLNTLIPADSGWVLQSARGINDKGQIVGKGTFNGQTRAYMLSPSAVQNLASTPGSLPEEVTLTWKAPDAGGGTSADAYDIRYSDVPLDENTWPAATQVQAEPLPGAPGTDEILVLPNRSSGTRWYFALKFQYPAGAWSALSNVPSLLDTGFRPPKEGYNFPNFGDVQDTDLTFSDMITLFGSQLAVCWNPIGPCIPRAPAAQWRAQALNFMTAGHCAGMSATSLRFFKGLDTPSAFQSGVLTAHDLAKPNARRQISYYWVPELLDPLASTRAAQRATPPTDTLDQLLAAMAGPASDPLNLDVYQGNQGHAITPFAVEERKDQWRVWVYNNNLPNVSSTVIITPTTESWEYDMGAGLGVWSGNAGTQSLAVYPISTFAQTADCPWCLFSQSQSAQPQAAGSGQVWLTGGHGLLTDGQGRRIGYVGEQFVNEIPGASANFPPGGLGIELEPIYTLPLAETYAILLDGQTLTQTKTVSLVQFGPGYASGAQGIPIGPTTQDHVVIAGDGRQVVYRASSDKEVTLLLTTDGATEGYQFQVEGADMTAGQPVTGTVDAANGLLAYNNHEAGDGEYGIAIRRAHGTGQYPFVHHGVQVSAADIHYLEYAEWDGHGALTLLIDHGGDGTIDETVQLKNQISHVYLPLVAKNP